MSSKSRVHEPDATMRLKEWLIDRLLGPAARAGRFPADQDAAIIGLFPRNLKNHLIRRRSLTNFGLSRDPNLSR